MTASAMHWIDLVAAQEQQAQATGFVAACCERQAVAASDTLRLTLVVEELFTNVLTHGCNGRQGVPVRIGLAVDAEALRLRFEDAAVPFDPRSRLAEEVADLDADAADRPVGHLGLPLIFGLASSVGYERAGDWNRLQLTLPRSR